MNKTATILLKVCITCTVLSVHAASIFFPDNSPLIRKVEAPDWLRDGREGDGYLTVSSQVIAENTCATLSDKSFWGSEKTQLVISVTTSGFKSKLNQRVSELYLMSHVFLLLGTQRYPSGTQPATSNRTRFSA